MNTTRLCLAACLAVCTLAATAQTQTSTNAAGPYYATPSWDQKLPSAARFIVLTNWGSEAVLDRETGLVWEASPKLAQLNHQQASTACMEKIVGGRAGWRLPTIQELFRTAVSGDGAIADSPFTNLAALITWSSTVANPNATKSRYVLIPEKFNGSFWWPQPEGALANVWCVQSPAPGAAAQ